MKIAFTICSNNYLAQAKVLGDSMLYYNPDYKFVICLVDEFSGSINYKNFESFEIVLAREVLGTRFSDMCENYNIIELNTAVKPSVIKHLKEKYSHANIVFYLDPDIEVFANFNELEQYLSSSDILITPHVLTPPPLDGKVPGENIFLNYGIYNLGFIGIKYTINSQNFLDWWEERTIQLCFDNVCEGYFVDQLWINLITIYFDKTHVLKEMGYNAGPWNLHERGEMVFNNNSIIMPDQSPLIFYHFSNYKPLIPEILSKHYNRYSFDLFPVLRELYNLYRNKVLDNNYITLHHIPCAYMKPLEVAPPTKSIKNRLLKILPHFIYNRIN